MGLAARQALGRSSWFGIADEKNQLSGFQGIKFPWKPTLSGSIEYHGPPRSGRLSFPWPSMTLTLITGRSNFPSLFRIFRKVLPTIAHHSEPWCQGLCLFLRLY